MALSDDRLREIVLELASRPGHEKVRADLHTLLVDGLGARSSEVQLEHPIPEVRGRIDALLGRTVFEFKRDLRKETKEAEEQLTRYLGEREVQTGERYVGIATDGATFATYELRHGSLRPLVSYASPTDQPRDLLAWLSAAVVVAVDLDPTPDVVRLELGRGSLAWDRAREALAEIWAEIGHHPDVRLKRDLWARLLEHVYGASVDSDELFFQHTYLTIVAKTMAIHVLGFDLPEPADLLGGRPFHEAGIEGVVESDFFDWLLDDDNGTELVRRIARQAARFRLRDVETDVLKGLYESLIDPEQRRYLGEYYTPDWLAERMCERAIEDPLAQRVLDPACGSGTFLFHAVRRLLDAAERRGLDSRTALELCCTNVLGVDVHPVAVLIARVTYLLALGEERLRDRPELAIPVYLGDSLQWNTEGMMADRDVLIEVPGESQLLHFPFAVARDQPLFAAVLGRMLHLSAEDADAEALIAWLRDQQALGESDIQTLGETYEQLRILRREGRDHIWGFLAANLVRPVWLSQPEQRADVVIGNPPWLAYRSMTRGIQADFRAECQRLGVWTGGRGVTPHQDLSAYFFARCVELYLKPGGNIVFVMPYAAMSRRQFEAFRGGWFGKARGSRRATPVATVRITEAWVFDESVKPLFPIPACVLIARQEEAGALPPTVLWCSGTLPRRDATKDEAERTLTYSEAAWPATRDDSNKSAYRESFRQGAIIIPRMLLTVEQAPAGRIGASPAAPLVQSRRSNREKPPWKDLESLRRNIEAQFLRPLFLGESVAPFRPLKPILAVIPWDEETSRILDAKAAQRAGYTHLAGWLDDAERLFHDHGRGTRTLAEQLDFYSQLSVQFPLSTLRVLYTKAGALPAATLVEAPDAVIDHKLYWAAVADKAEARYLLAVLNSEVSRSRVEHLQSRGQWGPRDFDKLMLQELRIARFDSSVSLHSELAEAAQRAEQVAEAVPLEEDSYFVTSRRRIREALLEEGVADRIDELVAKLLGPAEPR